MNEEILGGIKSAVSRGETLQQAMMTFFNAGYKREDIEEAARTFQQGNMQLKPLILKKKGRLKPKKVIKKKVSSYENPRKEDNAKKLLLTLILVASILFVGILVFFMLTK